MALVGAGPAAGFSTDVARKIASAIGLSMKQRRVAARGVSRARRRPRSDRWLISRPADLAQAVAEGLTLSEFNVGSYKTSDVPPGKAPAWTIVAGGLPDSRADSRSATRSAAAGSSASAATWRASCRTSPAIR